MRGMVETMKIPIFDRVSQIESAYRDVGEIPLAQEDVKKLHELEKITVIKMFGSLTASDLKAIEELVPPCRIASANNTANQIEVNVLPGNALACSAR